MAGTLTVQNIEGPSSGANANKIIIPSGQTFIPSSGQIIQTVQFLRAGSSSGSASGSRVETSSSSFTDLMTKSITTTVANSTIRVMANCVCYKNVGANMRGMYRVLRDSTEIDGDRYGYYANSTANMLVAVVDNFDTPSAAAGTTITYKFQGASNDGETHIFLYTDGGGAASNSITLQEIAP